MKRKLLKRHNDSSSSISSSSSSDSASESSAKEQTSSSSVSSSTSDSDDSSVTSDSSTDSFEEKTSLRATLEQEKALKGVSVSPNMRTEKKWKSSLSFESSSSSGTSPAKEQQKAVKNARSVKTSSLTSPSGGRIFSRGRKIFKSDADHHSRGKGQNLQKSGGLSVESGGGRKGKHRSVKNEEGDDDADDEDEHIKLSSSFNPATRSRKAKLVARLLVRWWYVLPVWPPPDYDYCKELAERKLRLVSIEEWEESEDVDENGVMKVYQISAFPGVFRDPYGRAIDLRCKEKCPCYTNFIRKSELELLQLIKKAIENQIEQLNQSGYNEDELRARLKNELSDVILQLQEIKR